MFFQNFVTQCTILCITILTSPISLSHSFVPSTSMFYLPSLKWQHFSPFCTFPSLAVCFMWVSVHALTFASAPASCTMRHWYSLSLLWSMTIVLVSLSIFFLLSSFCFVCLVIDFSFLSSQITVFLCPAYSLSNLLVSRPTLIVVSCSDLCTVSLWFHVTFPKPPLFFLLFLTLSLCFNVHKTSLVKTNQTN